MIMLAGVTDSLEAGIKKAAESIDSGQAMKKLEELRKMTGGQ